MSPWPRRVVNFPIVLIAIAQQYVAGVALLWQPGSHFATSMDILYLLVPVPILLSAILFGVATLSMIGFHFKRKVFAILALVPQQLLLYLSAGAAAHAIIVGHFADGVERPNAFLLTDQAPVVLIAFFHSWAMFLILFYSED